MVTSASVDPIMSPKMPARWWICHPFELFRSFRQGCVLLKSRETNLKASKCPCYTDYDANLQTAVASNSRAGDVLVTEKAGTLRVIRHGVLQREPIAGVPPVRIGGQGGLMDLVLAPDFPESRWIYMTIAKSSDDDSLGKTALIRGRFETSSSTDLMPDGKALQFFLAMEVKSVNTRPSNVTVVPKKGVIYEVTGIAWSGHGSIRRVEVSAFPRVPENYDYRVQ